MEVAETFVIWSQTFWTISRRNDRNRSREVLEGMVTACLKKSPASSFAIADLMYEVAGFITTSSKEYAENDTFPPPSSCPSCPSLLSIPSFPSSLVLFLACTVCIPSFYNFLFSLTARQIASRSMNFLERSCDCLPMFPFFFLSFHLYVSFSPFLLESMQCWTFELRGTGEKLCLLRHTLVYECFTPRKTRERRIQWLTKVFEHLYFANLSYTIYGKRIHQKFMSLAV